MLTLEFLPGSFTICQPESLSQADLSAPFTFLSVTDSEISLVCPREYVPADVRAREDGYTAFRVVGTLDLSLIGILARLSAVLAEAEIAVFALSTFDTDYILIREEKAEEARTVLRAAGYELR